MSNTITYTTETRPNADGGTDTHVHMRLPGVYSGSVQDLEQRLRDALNSQMQKRSGEE